jgi:hypothetical protein
VNLYLAWDTSGQQYGSCPSYLATGASVFLVDGSGTHYGTQSVSISTTDNIDQHTFSFTFPAETTAVGQFHWGLSLTGNAENGATTDGSTVPAGNSYDTPAAYNSWGLVSTGFMAGDVGSGSFSSDQTASGKNFPVVRLYNQDINNAPSSSVRTTYIDNGKLVIYSDQVTHLGQSGYPALGNCPGPNGSQITCTQWASVANGNQDSYLTANLSALNTWATDSGAMGEVIYAFSHEPWKHATDLVSGTQECVKSGNTCFGSSQDYRAAYTHIRNLITSNSYSNIRLMYIDVSDNMTRKQGTGAIGSGDVMYADNTAYSPTLACSLANVTPVSNCGSENVVDLLGPDVYNYYLWQSGASWRPLTFWLRDPSRGVVSLAKQLKKYILIAELGSHPGCYGNTDSTSLCSGQYSMDSSSNTTEVNTDWKGVDMTRDGWFLDGKETMLNNADVEQWLLGFAYYGTTLNHNWDFFNATTSTLDWGDCLGAHEPTQSGCPGSPNSAGWSTMVNSSWFLGTPTAS